jgi:hypothetical protein
VQVGPADPEVVRGAVIEAIDLRGQPAYGDPSIAEQLGP